MDNIGQKKVDYDLMDWLWTEQNQVILDNVEVMNDTPLTRCGLDCM